MPSTFLYGRPSDSLIPLSVATVNSGVEDPMYLAANIFDGQPEKPAGLLTTSGSWVFDQGVAKRVDLVAVIHHNFDPGLAVQVQLHTANAWGAPDVSQALTIPAKYADLYPVNAWLDLATLIPVDANRTRRYIRLNISGVNSKPLKVGEFLAYGTKRTLDIEWGSSRGLERPAVVHDTDYLIQRVYPFGVSGRTLQADVAAPTDAVISELDTWFRDADGVARPFLVVPHTADPDSWFVRFANTKKAYKRSRMNFNAATIEFKEAGRGLYP